MSKVAARDAKSAAPSAAKPGTAARAAAPGRAAKPRLPLTVNITDANPARAAQTAQLIATLTAALGLDPARLGVEVTADAAGKVAPHGARGGQQGDVIYLDPGRFDPAARPGRHVLAHELIHLRQRRNRDSRAALGSGALDAELEAERLAEAFLAGRRVTTPRAVLADDAIRFDVGGPAASAQQAGRAAEPADRIRPLADYVQVGYARECNEILNLLDHWIITDGHVEQILQILQPLAFETITALIGQVRRVGGPEKLHDYINNINPPHLRGYRREVLASYAALTPIEVQRFDEDLFEEMPLEPQSLSAPERAAAVQTLRCLPMDAQEALDRSDNGPNIRFLRSTPLDANYDPEAARRRQAEIESRRLAAGALAASDQNVARLLNDMKALLRDPNVDDVHAALDRLAGYEVGSDEDARFVPPPPTSTATPTAAPVAAPTPRGAAQPAQRPAAAQQPAAPRSPARTPLSGAALEWIAAELDAEGMIDRLIETLPEADRYNERYRTPFLALIHRRRPDRNMSLVQRLLSTGFLNWVWDDEARLAYDIVTQLPLVEQDYFRRLEHGELYRRLFDELPDEFKRSPFFHGLEVGRDENGQLFDTARRYRDIMGSLSEDPQIANLLRAFDRGVDRENAYTLFMRLVAIGDPRERGPAQASGGPVYSNEDRLRAVVRTLDARGHIRSLLENLGGGVLQDRRYWNEIAALLGARDPLMNAIQARDLLRESSFLFITLDEVTHEEALLAFQMIRTLPQADRDELAAAEGGALWSRLTSGLSESMLHEAGLSYAANRPDAHGETPLRRQLADPSVWQSGNIRELATLIGMLIAAGDFDWVFWESRSQRAWQRPELRALVARFELYDEQAGRTIPRPHVVSAARDSRSWLAVIFGTGAYELDFNTRPYTGADPFTGESTRYSEVEGVRFTADLEQLEANAGGSLFSSARVARSGGSRIAIDEDSREAALHQPNVVDVFISAERGIAYIRAGAINLSSFANVGPSRTIRTGPVTIRGLNLEVHFGDRELREPNAATISAGLATADESIVTTPDGVTGASHAELRNARLDGSFAIHPLPESPVLGPLFGLIWDLALNTSRIAADTLSRGPLLRALTVSFDALTIEGLHTSDGLVVTSASIEGAALSVGGNRAAYQRALIASYTRRMEQARQRGDAARLAELSTRRQQAQDELRRLAPLEAEMMELVRRMNSAGGRLSPTEEERLAELQRGLAVGARGGVVADIGSVSVNGVDGPVAGVGIRLRQGAITNIHAEGETTALALEQLTSRQAIERFINQGPPGQGPIGEATADAGITFTSDDIVLHDLVLPAAIPGASTLREELAQLTENPRFRDDPTLDGARAHLRELIVLVDRYEALRSASLEPRDGQIARSPAVQQQLEELSRQLSEMVGLRIEEASIEGPRVVLGASAGEQGHALATAGAARIYVRGAHGGGTSVDSVEAHGLTGSLSFRRSGLDAMGDADRQLEIAVAHADDLTVLGLRTRSGTRLDRLRVENLNGAMTVERAGLHFHDVSLGPIEVQGFDYISATNHLWSTGTTVLDRVTADVTVPFRREAQERNTQAPISAADRTHYHINSFHITAIHADHLGYEAFVAGHAGTTRYRVDVDSGTIGDVTLSDFDITMPEGGETGFTGRVGIGSFDDVQFRAAYQQTLTAAGTLNRRNMPDQPNAVDVGFAQKGDMTVNLRQLQFTDTEVNLPDRRSGRGITITRADVTGDLAIHGNQTRINNLHLGDLVMRRIDWRTEDGATLRADGETRLTDVMFSGAYRSIDEQHAEYQVDSLTVARITATHLVYDDPPLRVELRPDEAGDASTAMEITGVKVENLLVGTGSGRTVVGPAPSQPGQPAPAAATIGVATSRFDFLVTQAEDLRANGRLWANRLSVRFTRDGRIVARSRDAAIDTDVGYHSGTGTDRLDAVSALRATGIDTGDVSYGRGVLSFGPEGSDGLRTADIFVRNLSVESDRMKVSGLTDSTTAIGIHGLRARLDIHLHRSAEAQRAADTPFERIVVRDFHIDDIIASGLLIHLKQQQLFLELPADTQSGLHDLTLNGLGTPGSPESFTIMPQRGGGFRTMGIVEMHDIFAERAQAHLLNTLNTRFDFNAQTLRIGLLESGDMNVDLESWSITDIVGYILGDPRQRIRLSRGTLAGTRHPIEPNAAGFSGQGLHYDGARNEVRLTGVDVQGLRYDNAANGVHLDIRRVNLPPESPLTIPLGASAAGTRHIEVPQLTIEDAYFQIEDLMRLGGGAPAAPSAYFIGQSAVDWISSNPALFTALNGTIELHGELPTFDFGSIDLNIPVVNGEVSYDAIENQVFSGVTDALADFRAYPEEGVLRFGFGFRYYPPTEAPAEPTPVDLYEWVAEWDLSAGELARARSPQYLVRLDTLLRGRSPGFVPPPPGAAPAPPSGIVRDISSQLQINSLNISLHTDNTTDLPIQIPPYGSITLAAHGIGGLSVTGSLQPVDPRLTRDFTGYENPLLREFQLRRTNRPGQIQVGLQRFDISTLDLNFPAGPGQGGVHVTRGAISIRDVVDTHVDFRGWTPRGMEGTIRSASARNLTLDLLPALAGPAPPRPAGAPPPETGFRRLTAEGSRFAEPVR